MSQQSVLTAFLRDQFTVHAFCLSYFICRRDHTIDSTQGICDIARLKENIGRIVIRRMRIVVEIIQFRVLD